MTSPVASPTSPPGARASLPRPGVAQGDTPSQAPQLPAEAPRRDPAAAETSMEFSYDRITRRIVIRVVSRDTGEVLRQIPPEEYLAFVARFRELVGAIFDRRV